MIVGNLVFYQHDSLARDTPKKYIYYVDRRKIKYNISSSLFIKFSLAKKLRAYGYNSKNVFDH